MTLKILRNLILAERREIGAPGNSYERGQMLAYERVLGYIGIVYYEPEEERQTSITITPRDDNDPGKTN